jgi:hypothetical protein
VWRPPPQLGAVRQIADPVVIPLKGDSGMVQRARFLVAVAIAVAGASACGDATDDSAARGIAAARTDTAFGQSGYDLALGKPATQSSTPSWGKPANAATDGNRDGNFGDGSVTHTDRDQNAWWQVDLGKNAMIDHVGIYGRTDCCSERLTDYYLLYSESPFSSQDLAETLAQPGVGSIHAGDPAPAIPVGATARYLRIQLNGTNYLSLAEVEVIGFPNLALGKSASQSSTAFGGVASRAVDGNTDGNYYRSGSVTHTDSQLSAWWEVDLGDVALIDNVEVWTRTDCCADRSAAYLVTVSDAHVVTNAIDPPVGPDLLTVPVVDNALAPPTSLPDGSVPAIPPSVKVPIHRTGRFVRIQLVGANYLSLAEVRVFGWPDLALNRPATQSSDPFGASAGRAVDGNLNTDWSGGSVTHTNLDAQAWWDVDLGSSAPIDAVAIFGRTDCCTDRLGDYWVLTSQAAFGSSAVDPTNLGAGTTAQHVVGGTPASMLSYDAGTTARFVRVQLAGTNYLSLGEVIVLGSRPVSPRPSQLIDTVAGGRVQLFPDLGAMLANGEPGGRVEASYFKTTDTNRRIVRGIMEFAIPSDPAILSSATLVLTENQSFSAPLTPSHTLLLRPYTAAADGVVTTADYDVPVDPFVSFTDQASDHPKQQRRFDVGPERVGPFAGATMGFRLELDIDPELGVFDSFSFLFDSQYLVLTPLAD